MIAKQYEKTTYRFSGVSIVLGLLVFLSPFFGQTLSAIDWWSFSAKFVLALGFMGLVFILLFLDNKTNILGFRAIHLLLFPLLMLALPAAQYTFDLLLVFALLIFLMNNYTKIGENKEIHKELFTTSVLLTLLAFYNTKYLFYLLLPLSFFTKSQYFMAKHLLAMILPLVFIPFFVFAFIAAFEFPYEIKPLQLTSFDALLHKLQSPQQLFWLFLMLTSLLGFFRKKSGPNIAKIANAFYFMFYILLTSLLLLFFNIEENSEQMLLGLIAATYFFGHLIVKLKYERTKDFIIIAILFFGIIIKNIEHNFF